MKIKLFLEEAIEIDSDVENCLEEFSISFYCEEHLPLYINSIQIIGENNYTFIYCRESLIKGKKYKYTYSNRVNGIIDYTNTFIKSLKLHYQELDYLPRKFASLTPSRPFKGEEDLINDEIYKNSDLSIKLCEYYIAEVEFNHSLINYCINIETEYTQSFRYDEYYEKVREIENSFGFAIFKKMHLLDMTIIDSENKQYDIVTKIMSKCSDEILLRPVYRIEDMKYFIKAYFDNNIMRAVINSYYEYIYNDLDIIFMFSNICNALEMISNISKYKEDIGEYINKNIDENIKEKEIYSRIYSILDNDEDKKYFACKCSSNYFSLRSILHYFLHRYLNMQYNDNSKQFVGRINRTRNYYSHGSNEKNIFTYIEIEYVVNVLKNILFMAIIEACVDAKDAERLGSLSYRKENAISSLKAYFLDVHSSISVE